MSKKHLFQLTSSETEKVNIYTLKVKYENKIK